MGVDGIGKSWEGAELGGGTLRSAGKEYFSLERGDGPSNGDFEHESMRV